MDLNIQINRNSMPEYIHRTVESFCAEYALNQMNPEGNLYQCVFCNDFFKTKSERLSHMKRCCLEEAGEEFELDMPIYSRDDAEISMSEFFESEEAEHNTVLQLIESNEMEEMATTYTYEQIKAFIILKLISNGFCMMPDIFITDFKIYKFFFVVSDTERGDWNKRALERIRKELHEMFD